MRARCGGSSRISRYFDASHPSDRRSESRCCQRRRAEGRGMIRPRIVALLGLASGLDYAAQVLVPILLVRVLSAHDFGGYRLLWLAAQTCANILSISVAGLPVQPMPHTTPHRSGG